MKRKQFLCLLIALLTIVTIGCVTTPAADINAGAGEGGSLAEAAANSGWWHTDQGVRISLYEVKTGRVKNTIDVTNLTDAQIAEKFGQPFWYGLHDKQSYRNGRTMALSHSKYEPGHFADAIIPPVILAGEGNNIEAVKNFFRDENILRQIARKFGIDFDEMTGGDYKILLEPVAYFKLNGKWFVMTATEAALYQQYSGDTMFHIMGNLTNRNLPLSMFLERDDIGFRAWTGPQSGYRTASEIFAYLGIGIISFDGEESPTSGRKCCDCDKWCPCKFDRAGSRIKAGDCWCFGTGANSHEGHIPCTPDYPDNCLCAKHNIGVHKVDATTGAGLGGAVMRLTSKTTGQVITGTTDASGSLIFRGVHLGNWYLDEVTAPNEYVRSGERIDIELTTSGVKVYGATTTPKYMGGLAYAPYNDSNPITAIYTNEKSSLIVPAAGDNILYAYQLTKSFTNATNFSDYVNFPTNVAPSYTNCSGETRVSNSRSYPYGYTLKGGVSTTYHPAWDETVQKRQWNEETRQWEQVEEIVHHDAYDTYSYTYLHNNAHRVGYTWESGDVTVPLGAYLSSGSFSSGGMEKYKIMHNGGNYLYGFNLNNAYTVSRTGNLFRDLTAKTWISHRNGALTSQTNEIKLAAYMGDQNAAYRSFYQTYTGNTPNASNSNDTNPSSYATANGIAMGTTHGGTCSREYTATYCNGLTRTESYSASTNNATQKYQYSVEGSYKAGARTVIGSTVGNDVIRSTSTKSYSTENGTIYRFLTPSNVFSFYPTYRMWYTDTLGSNDGKTAWMLSGGRRTFQATDMVTVTTSGGTTDVWAPWSRDWEDKYMEGSEYMNEVRRPYSVIKSGMVVKAVQSEPATITIKAAFHIQDPKYAINGTEAAVTAANNAKAREMMAQVKEIANSYTGNLEAEFGFYSNLWEATSQNIASRVPALDVKPASYATTESPKTRLEPIVKKTANAPAYTFTSVSASPDSPVSSLGAITLDGHTYSASNGTLSANISNHTGSQRAMGYLLDTAFNGSSKYFIGSAANSASGDKSRWYEEYYDGIRVCIITCTIKVPSEGIMTEYHQVHSQLSDSTTPMNAEAKNLTVYGTRLFKDGMFGIGLCAIPGNGMTVFGNTYNNNILIWPAKHFGVRGSVYDLAQHAGQEILYYNSAWY